MILIYAQHVSPRLQYITKFIFSGILHVTSKLTVDTGEYISYSGPKINYSFQSLDGINILPKSLLFKEGIMDLEVDVVWSDDLPLLFHQCGDADLPFDPFAASFYMVSRYEEYTNKERDVHGRFMASFSLAAKNGFLSIPVVDRWAYLLRSVIESHYPTFSFPDRIFRFIPTVDVDSVAVFKGKPLIYLLGSTVKAVFRGDLYDLQLRWKTWIGKLPDPLDTFSLLDRLHKAYDLNPVYFFLVGEHAKFDGNLPSNNPLMIRTVQEIASRIEVGIHPSYRSNSELSMVEEEIKTLGRLSGKTIFRSRQHFLKMNLPQTYQTLVQCGIREDYTMGFADALGFRAGTCTPFPFYDLDSEKEINLMVFPLTVMDVTLQFYLQLTPEKAMEITDPLIREIKKVNGTFITLWHNSFLYDSKKNKSWGDVYSKVIEKACAKE